jgi:hypothetical protein
MRVGQVSADADFGDPEDVFAGAVVEDGFAGATRPATLPMVDPPTAGSPRRGAPESGTVKACAHSEVGHGAVAPEQSRSLHRGRAIRLGAELALLVGLALSSGFIAGLGDEAASRVAPSDQSPAAAQPATPPDAGSLIAALDPDARAIVSVDPTPVPNSALTSAADPTASATLAPAPRLAAAATDPPCDFTGPAVLGAGHVSETGQLTVALGRCMTLVVTSGSIAVGTTTRCGGLGDQICVFVSTTVEPRTITARGDPGHTWWTTAFGSPTVLAEVIAPEFWDPSTGNCGGGCTMATIVPYLDGRAQGTYRLVPRGG